MDRTASGVARCIRFAREGQGEALNALLDTYRNYLGFLAATGIDPALRGKVDGSDVVQEALVKAYRNFHQFRGTTEQEWLSWMRKILATCLADVHRRFSFAKREFGRERSLESILDRSSQILRHLVPAGGVSPVEGAEVHETSVFLADALAELGEDDREVVVLRNFHELDWGEVALRMGRSPDAVRMLWTRALQKLGDLLKDHIP